MKIAYQVKLNDAVTGNHIGRDVWFESAARAMTESYVLMEQLEKKYGSFFIWDNSIPFQANEDNSEITILQGIMPGMMTMGKTFSLHLSRKQVSDGFEFAEPRKPEESINAAQIIVRKNIGSYFKQMDHRELETYRQEKEQE